MVQSYLNELHNYMENHADAKIRELYQKCDENSLRHAKKILAFCVNEKYAVAKSVDLKARLLSAVEANFRVSLPLEQEGVICSKLWEALYSILNDIKSEDANIKRTVRILTEAGRRAVDIRPRLSEGRGPDPLETNLPPQFVQAWRHLIMLLLIWDENTTKIVSKHAEKFRMELDSAYEIVLLGKTKVDPLRALRAPIPSELSILLVRNVLKDDSSMRRTISDIYWDYFGNLKQDDRPPSRDYQSKLRQMLDEIRIIEHHLKGQRTVLDNLSGLYKFSATGDAFFDRFQLQVLEDWMDTTKGKTDSLESLQKEAKALIKSTEEQIVNDKEKQDAAIYVSTIVTIVFLPISTVSSIFGMNTKDIRDMENSQWLYWAVAIPVTLVVVIGSLFGAGVVRIWRRA